MNAEETKPVEPDPSTPEAIAEYDALTVRMVNEKSDECRVAIETDFAGTTTAVPIRG